MSSSILFSNATFDEPAQANVLRSKESVKPKVRDDDTLKLYKPYIKDLDIVKKKETIINSKSINNYVEHQIINTVLESQTSKIDVISEIKPLTKKRKLKIIPNKIEVFEEIDALHKKTNFINKVNLIYFFCIYMILV